jgi:AraC-like DNA-binding protein
MKNECSRPKQPVTSCATTLTAVWKVDVGKSYDITRTVLSREMVAIRTLNGAGEIHRRNSDPLVATSGSVILLHQKDLLRYRCSGSRWSFFWFHFSPNGVLPLPTDHLFDIPDSSEESAERGKIIQEIKNPSIGTIRMASARFSMLLCHWAVAVEIQAAPHPHRQRVARVIEEMGRQIGTAWTVQSMARDAGLSVRRFRQVFPEITGASPKEFYDQLRMQQAYELLQNRICNVSETSVQLGFSSPFHFSKAFKKHFGMPPSACQQSHR